MLNAMDDEQQVISGLTDTGVLVGFIWAWGSASAQTLEDFSEEQGHDEAWFGTTRHTLLKDRMHRVFSTGKYLHPVDGVAVDTSLVLQGLRPAERESLPKIEPGMVRYRPLNGSPAWVCGGHRYLLASAPVGRVADLPWSRKSPTKQAVAARPAPDLVQSLFTASDMEDPGDVLTPWFDDLAADALVLAHSLSSSTGVGEFVLGRPCDNDGGGSAWYWHRDLLAFGPRPTPRRAPKVIPIGDDSEPDALVRLRRSGVSGLEQQA
jgi:hypothetical protein